MLSAPVLNAFSFDLLTCPVYHTFTLCNDYRMDSLVTVVVIFSSVFICLSLLVHPKDSTTNPKSVVDIDIYM